MKELKTFGKLTYAWNKLKRVVDVHAPELLVAGGVIGIAAGTIAACIATLKSKKVLDAAKLDISEIHERASVNSDEEHGKIEKRELTAAYLRTAAKIIGLYAPSIILLGLSTAEIVTSNTIQRKRLTAMSAAYAAIDKGFKDYRARVIERFGPETDKELRFGIKEKKIQETTVNPETGKEKTEKKTIQTTCYDGVSEYARFFDCGNPEWVNNSDYNVMLLRAKQNFANDKLAADGYLYLNDVYDMLNIHRTRAGQVVGWIYNKNDPTIDSFVDFGIREIYRNDSVGNPQSVFLLDFNVDGPILDYAHKEKI